MRLAQPLFKVNGPFYPLDSITHSQLSFPMSRCRKTGLILSQTRAAACLRISTSITCTFDQLGSFIVYDKISRYDKVVVVASEMQTWTLMVTSILGNFSS